MRLKVTIATFGYDGYGRKVSETNVDGHSISTVFDKGGNPISITDQLGNTSYTTYDERGRAIIEQDAKGFVRINQYDVKGNLVATSDEVGTETKFTYDDLDRLIRTEETESLVSSRAQVTGYSEKSEPVEFRYDVLGRKIASVRDDQTTLYTYDDLSRLVSTHHPNGYVESTTYDSLSRPVTVTDREGTITTFTYNDRSMVVTKSSTDGVSTLSTNYTYNQYGENIEIDADNELETFVYGTDGKLNSRTVEYSNLIDPNTSTPFSYTTSYAYDTLDRVSTKTTPRGDTIGFTYNTLSLLDSVSFNSSTVASYSYDDANKVVTKTSGNGVVTSMTYDEIAQPIDINIEDSSNTLLKSLQYVYDQKGSLLSTKDDTGAVYSYEYDEFDQLVKMNINDGSSSNITYEYDKYNNRTEQDSPLKGVESYGYDSDTDHLLNHTASTGEYTTYAYNGRGDTVSKVVYDSNGGNATDTATYTYDILGRMVGISQTGSNPLTHSYLYDDSGSRIYKDTGTVEKWYINSGNTVDFEIDDAGEITKTLIYGSGHEADVIHDNVNSTDSIQYLHTDRLGSVSISTNENEEVIYSFISDPFGNVMEEKTRDDSEPQDFTFTDQQIDRETGLMYYGARYYDPKMGRFLQEDPVLGVGTDPKTYNGYIYVTNNPLKYTDPDGRYRRGALRSFKSAASSIRGRIKAKSMENRVRAKTRASHVSKIMSVIKADPMMTSEEISFNDKFTQSKVKQHNYSDRASFLQFLADANSQILSLQSAYFRSSSTLQGSSGGSGGLSRLPGKIHQIEQTKAKYQAIFGRAGNASQYALFKRHQTKVAQNNRDLAKLKATRAAELAGKVQTITGKDMLSNPDDVTTDYALSTPESRARIETILASKQLTTATSALAMSFDTTPEEEMMIVEEDLGFLGNSIRDQLSHSLARDMFSNYWLGNGEYQFSEGEFDQLIVEISQTDSFRTSTLVESGIPDYYYRSVDTSSIEEYNGALGKIDIYYHESDLANPVGFRDVYDFNPQVQGKRSWQNEVKTRMVYSASMMTGRLDNYYEVCFAICIHRDFIESK